MNRKNDLHPYMFEQSINTSVVVACLNDLCRKIKKKTIVVMDNSSIHRSEEFEDYIAQWKQKGLPIKYLTPYAPELNLIEILWRHIKYLWFPFAAYQCMEVLREALEHILKEFGSKYQITFA
jgi:transposase